MKLPISLSFMFFDRMERLLQSIGSLGMCPNILIGFFSLSCLLLRLASNADGDLLLCPVRAFNTYLGMVRGGPRYSVNSPLWSLDGKGLSGLFKSTVLQARLRAGLSEVVSIGPHHMRKLAASYSARMIGSSPEGERKLMDRMGCASMNVLKRTYINNVPSLSFKVVLPAGTFVPDTEVCVI